MKRIIEATIGAIFSTMIIISGIMLIVNAQSIFENGDMTSEGSISGLGIGILIFGIISLVVSIIGTLHPIGHKLVQFVISISTMLLVVAFASIYGMSLIVKPMEASGFITTIPTSSTAGKAVPAGEMPAELILAIVSGILGAVSLSVFKLFFGGVIISVSTFSSESFKDLEIKLEKLREKNENNKKAIEELKLEDNNKNELRVEFQQSIEKTTSDISMFSTQLKEEIIIVEKINKEIQDKEVILKMDAEKIKQLEEVNKSKEDKKTKELEETKDSKKISEDTNKQEVEKNDNSKEVIEDIKAQESEKASDSKLKEESPTDAKKVMVEKDTIISSEIKEAKQKIEIMYASSNKKLNEISENVNLVEKKIAKEKDLNQKESKTEKNKDHENKKENLTSQKENSKDETNGKVE